MLIAIEGIDGSGKKTQTALLADRARAAGLSVATLAFPRYGQTFFAQSIGQYLDGRLGDPGPGSAHFAALLYAGDRFESLAELEGLQRDHDLLVCDRYVASNLAYQAAKLPAARRPALLQWIGQLEFDVYRLPRPALNIFLDVPAPIAAGLIGLKGQRSYTAKAADLHEADSAYLATCREVFHALAASGESGACGPWATVACTNAHGRLLDTQSIAQRLWEQVQVRLARP